MTEEQLTFDDALANRDAVLAEVAENNSEWMAEAIGAIEALPVGTQGTGEDIRLMLREAGLSAPKHQNAYGALFNTAKRRGLIVATGEYRPMRLKSSHGRETRVYARVSPA